MAVLYLLHFDPPYRHARHYLGYSDRRDPFSRIAQHLAGRGSPLVAAALAAGCRVLVADWWPGDRTRERLLKRRAHVPAWCPLCQNPKLLARFLRSGQRDAAELLRTVGGT